MLSKLRTTTMPRLERCETAKLICAGKEELQALSIHKLLGDNDRIPFMNSFGLRDDERCAL